MTTYRIKRVYDAPAPNDGWRVLVDRLWPRGVTHERAQLDDWVKQVAPSPALRKWWDHDPQRFDEFSARYREELQDDVHRTAVDDLIEHAQGHSAVTLLYGAHDPNVNHALVLRDDLEQRAAEHHAKEQQASE